ncbi:MAG TPA: MBOAT family protein [Campylobacterales bacterium]|nr:MBOAT family protein [Campylobacterales bacterium]
MLFNSYIFIFAFLPITFTIYFYLNHKNLIKEGRLFLVLSSLFFYSWWNIVYLPLILISMIFNYIVGGKLLKNKTDKKLLLTIGVLANLALLGYFKYADFFIENINLTLGSDMGLLHLALPLAISFFTFQQIAYLVDSYRQETREYDFLNYAIFVTFFPQLIAGPIVHHKEMMPQFARDDNRFINHQNIAMGLFIFSIGLFKKVIIADTFAIWATTGFDTATTLNLIEAWSTSLSYTFQLYFDFSGYTDMAIGVALLFNIKLPTNFNSPYKATDIQDFWRRWHITLSRFLRDYIYIPLGGNRKGSVRTYTNLLTTFILGGLWHGAGWTFIFWGFLHGMALVIHRFWAKLGIKLWTWLAWLITFNFINISWVFFRAKEWEDAIKVLSAMFSLDNIVLHPALSSLKLQSVEYGKMFSNIGGDNSTAIWIIATLLSLLVFKNSIERLENFKTNNSTAIITAIALSMGILSLNKISEFLYFNF